MIQAQQFKFGLGVAPIDTTGAAMSSTAFDSMNGGRTINHLSCIIAIGNLAANSSAGTFRITESATSAGSYTAITGLTFTDLVAGGATPDDGKLFFASWPLGGARLRFYKAELTGGAGATLVCAIFMGERLNQTPNTAAERGITGEQLIV